MTRIACIGEAMIELSMTGAQANVGVAGDTLNTAIYLRRSAPNVQVDYVTCLGTDPFSRQILDFIGEQDIGTQTIRMIEGASPGLYAIVTTPEGERSFTYWRSTSAARRLFEDGNFDLLKGYDAIYLSGISVAILPDSVRHGLLDWVKASGVRLIYDSNYRPALWENEAQARKVTTAYWAQADIALPSIDDEMALFGETEQMVEARFLAGQASGALKRGADGPLSLGSDVSQTYPPASSVVDTTAAGDSFNGGYLGAILSGQSQKSALMAGHTLASNVVQHRGAIMPRKAG